MKLEEIYQQESDWAKRIEIIESMAPEVDSYIDEYWNMARDVRDEQVGNRPNKLGADGATITVNKIPIPFQQKIVRTASAMLFGNPVKIESDQEIDELLTHWERYRLNSYLLRACEEAKAFTQSAILFRIDPEVKEPNQGLRINLLSPTVGRLIPIWDTFEKLDAFAYQTEIEEEDQTITKTYIFDLLTVTVIVKDKDGTKQESVTPHGFDRMPIVYFEEEKVEWDQVKHLIDRYEHRFSKFADTNDYFSSPFFKATGNVENVPKRDDTGSVYMMDVIETDSGQIITSNLDVVSWDAAPQATKMELELTQELIYSLSSTPDLSFENVKGLGSVSGIALKLMFLDSMLKGKFSERIYKPAVQRTLNVFLSGLIATRHDGVAEGMKTATFFVTFQSIMPDNLQETIAMLTDAVAGRAVMSQETAIAANPLVDDPKGEIEKLRAEDAASDPIGGTFEV